MILLPPYTTRQYGWVAVLWTLGMVLAFSIPASSLTPVQPVLSADKLIHFVLFFVFGSLWMRVLCPPVPGARKRGLWKAVAQIAVLGGLFAGGAEIYQHVLPVRRTADPYDATANGIGLAVALVVYAAFIYNTSGSEKPSSS